MTNHFSLSRPLFFFLFFVGCFLLFPDVSHAQRRKSCYSDSERRIRLPDSKSILKLSERRGSRAPLSSSATARTPRRSKINPFTLNQTRSPFRPSDRDRFYGMGVWELGVNAGLAHAFTDVSGKIGQENFPDMGDFILDNASYSFGFFTRNKINEWFGLAFGADMARLAGSNALGYRYVYQATDGPPFESMVYSFRNQIAEVSAKMELYTPPLGRQGLQLYGFAGFGAFYTNPMMFDQNGLRVDLQSTTSGPTGNRPSGISLALPVGGGITMVTGNYLRIGYEIGYRYTGNNAIDGAFVPETPYDAYLFNTIRIGYVFPMRNSSRPFSAVAL